MISVAGWVVLATLNGNVTVETKTVFKVPEDCYNSLVAWPRDEGDKAEYQCFYIEAQPVEFEVKVKGAK